MIVVEIYNQTKFRINNKKLINLSKFVLKKLNKNINISIVAIGKEEMRRVNRQYRGIDKATDGLSFNYNKDMYGEILICPEYIINEANKLNVTQKIIYETVLIHSLLHVCGYNHKNRKQTDYMEKQEKKFHIDYNQTNRS